MRKLRYSLLSLGAVAMIVVPAVAAHADTTIGGQSLSLGPCDATVASVTFTPTGGISQITVGHVDCS